MRPGKVWRHNKLSAKPSHFAQRNRKFVQFHYTEGNIVYVANCLDRDLGVIEATEKRRTCYFSSIGLENLFCLMMI
jgi:hypothetical protein